MSKPVLRRHALITVNVGNYRLVCTFGFICLSCKSVLAIHNIHEWICGARQRIPTATIPDVILFKVARYLFIQF